MFASVFFFKQKTAYEMRISDWSSDVCSSDLVHRRGDAGDRTRARQQPARHRTLQRPDHLQRVDLHRLGYLAVERVDLRPQRARVQRLAADGKGLGHLARTAAAVFLHAQQEGRAHPVDGGVGHRRSEEHTSELQSLMRISYAVFCLKKKNNT